jgi:HK97 family phage portal protein
LIADRLAQLIPSGESRSFIGSGTDLLLGGPQTDSGERVTGETAMKVAAVYAATSIIANSIRLMPMRVLEDRGDNVLRPRRDHRLWDLLHDQPNPEMHAADVWEWATWCLILRGNAYLYLQRGRDGRVEWLRPINPLRVDVGRDPDTRRKMFAVYSADDREQVQYLGDTFDILHIKGLGLDPLVGVSAVHYLAETIGRARVEDRHSASTVNNSARPGGILKVPNKLSTEAAARLKAQWDAAHGKGKGGGTAVLEQDADWEQVSMSSSDIELAKQRSISREDIAVGFQIPGDMMLLGIEGGLHYSTDLTRDVRLLKHAVMPWGSRIQTALEICEMLPWGVPGGRLLPRLHPDALLRADIKSRYEAHRDGVEGGFITPNEAREVEDKDPLPDGDRLRQPKPKSDPESRSS